MSAHTSDNAKLVYTTPNLLIHGTLEKIVQNINVPGTGDTLFDLTSEPCQSGEVPNGSGIGCHAP
jgi:hypothetical protein